MSGPANEAVFSKLRTMLGESEATKVISSVLSEMAVEELDGPDSRLEFAEILIGRGGLIGAIGRSVKIQAIMQGARGWAA